ncbi:branched-chain amino acid ABC transporter substrate-binding protein [Variovorax sp. WS11]|uniref:ABC transporter substrate-binding protein n=1 Tax=Variovorax sp. WS11 TaxID=1105204 RepID=UPI000D0CA7EB|nr:ABC transporter substrate-binding protein [Variovorax sp. WS11]NDZ18183.1 ABC transporter substrate-binding protein [Variovorax sp. WS11]PSL80598.1 branched-chain amino acid ABC transporter substrate-binding protein [Variovorax sp. WS11]
MRASLLALLTAAGLAAVVPAQAQKKYGPGASDTEIKLGQTVAYSGPGSAYSMVGRMSVAYFKMLNETQGGINGRKINLLSVDDAYSPPKTVEVTRKLVESDQVLGIVNSMGTAAQTAVQKYLNAKQVPQLLFYASSPGLHDSKATPWTVPFSFAYDIEGSIFGKYLAEAKPNAKIGVLYQNDDVGKSYIRGFRKALGERQANIVKEVSQEMSDPTVDSQILQLQASGADTLVVFASNKAQAQAIKKVGAIGWKPLYIVPFVSSSITGVLTPAGLDNSVGLVSSYWFKTPSDPAWAEDKAMQDYLAFFKKYLPNDDPGDTTSVYTYMGAQLTALALQRCGDNLTRENLLKQIQGLKDVELGMLLPGMKINFRADDYYPIRQARLARFDGKSWKPMTELITIER